MRENGFYMTDMVYSFLCTPFLWAWTCGLLEYSAFDDNALVVLCFMQLLLRLC